MPSRSCSVQTCAGGRSLTSFARELIVLDGDE
jgi:hypothetical protein